MSRQYRTKGWPLVVKAQGSNAPSMAELVARELARPKVADPRLVTPGRVNREGNLCDLDGTILSLVDGEWNEEDALAAVRAGGHVAFESCGCGGGCAPDWFGADDLREVTDPPRAIRGSAPSWIEIWQSQGRQIVFVHGDFAWPKLF